MRSDRALDANSPPYRLEDQVGYLLRQASQRHSALFLDAVPFHLTPTQFAALIKLAELGECSQNDLGRRTSMDVATIKGVVERLRAKGLVEVSADPNDKRRTILSIAPDHLDMVPQLHAAGHAISKLTLSPLTQAEQASFLRLLKKLG